MFSKYYLAHVLKFCSIWLVSIMERSKLKGIQAIGNQVQKISKSSVIAKRKKLKWIAA